jgi:hypothetical protein
LNGDETTMSTTGAEEKRALSPTEQKKERAVEAMGRAMQALTPGEKKVLAELKKEVELAQRYADSTFDKQLEFCYAIHFASDRLGNQRLLKAVKDFIDACQEDI